MTPGKVPFRKRLGLNIFAQYRKAQADLHPLTYLFWECTLRCNLSCRHCGSDCQRQSDVPDMPLVDFLRVLDEIRPACNPGKTTIALTGGEPLLRTDLETCGAAFVERGFRWGMVSNGYGLTSSRLQSLVGNGLRGLTISLDGLEDSHNWLRGRSDAFQRALAGIEAAAAVAGLTFDVVTCVNQKNFGELCEVRDLLIRLGLTKWRLFTIFPKGRAEDDALLDVTNDQFRQLMAFIQETPAGGRHQSQLRLRRLSGSLRERSPRWLFLVPCGHSRRVRAGRWIDLGVPEPAGRLHSGQHLRRQLPRLLEQPFSDHAGPKLDEDRDLR